MEIRTAALTCLGEMLSATPFPLPEVIAYFNPIWAHTSDGKEQLPEGTGPEGTEGLEKANRSEQSRGYLDTCTI